jgi:hypothetical protein
MVADALDVAADVRAEDAAIVLVELPPDPRILQTLPSARFLIL